MRRHGKTLLAVGMAGVLGLASYPASAWYWASPYWGYPYWGVPAVSYTTAVATQPTVSVPRYTYSPSYTYAYPYTYTYPYAYTYTYQPLTVKPLTIEPVELLTAK